LEVIRELRTVVEQIKVYDVQVAKQLRNAASNTAHGEAREVLGAHARRGGVRSRR
jgi:hypothetical protein